MRAFSILAFALSFAVCGLGQQTYSIPPNSVPLSTREAWCSSQESQCPLICLQIGARTTTGTTNNCNPATLTYTCICPNGITPNVSQYSLTMPYFICTEWGTRCVAQCGTDSQCASDCRQNHPCGAQDTSPPNKTIISASKSAAAAASTKTKAGAVHTGFADGTNSKGAAGQVRPPVLLGMSGNSGMMIVFGALFLGFALGL